MFAAGISHVNAGKVSRIVLDQQRFFEPACPGTQDTAPIAKIVEVDAVPLDDARDCGQKIQKELIGIHGMPKRLLSLFQTFLPGRQVCMSFLEPHSSVLLFTGGKA